MHCWKDSPCMLFSCIVAAFLMTSTTSKWALLIISELIEQKKIPRKQDQLNRKIVPVRPSPCRPGTAGCAPYEASLLFRHAQIFGDNLPNVAFFRVQLTCNHSNSQITITMHHLSYLVDFLLKASCLCGPL